MDLDTLIEVSPGEVRIAGLDGGGVLQTLEIERASRPPLTGAVFRARVIRVEKAMRAAFVDLGASGEALLPKGKDADGKPVTEGQWLLVQGVREAQGEKGPAVTARPVLTDRYLAYAPYGQGIEYDRRLGQGRERAGAEQSAEAAALGDGGSKGGWKVRRPAAAADPDLLRKAAERLTARWEATLDANRGAKPLLLEAAPDAWERAARAAPPGGRIATDDRLLHSRIERSAREFWPDLLQDLMFHNETAPLFEAAGVEEQIDEAVSRTVPLDGGGNLIFDEAEAMTVVDVNLAEGASALKGADAAVRLNLRAAEAVGRQIRLRNLSGLIVIDFVKMQRRAEGKRVIEALRRALKGAGNADVLGMTAAGLVEVTRQRVGPRLSDLMLTPIAPDRPVTSEALACRLLREALRLRGGGKPTLTAPSGVLNLLRGEMAGAVAETEKRLGQTLVLSERADIAPEVRMEVTR